LQIDSFWYIDFTLFSLISLAYTYFYYSSIVKIADKFEFYDISLLRLHLLVRLFCCSL
jgi:hypothetical protein